MLQVPDIYDSAKYDSIHNRHLGLGFRELYQVPFTCRHLVSVLRM